MPVTRVVEIGHEIGELRDVTPVGSRAIGQRQRIEVLSPSRFNVTPEITFWI